MAIQCVVFRATYPQELLYSSKLCMYCYSTCFMAHIIAFLDNLRLKYNLQFEHYPYPHFNHMYSQSYILQKLGHMKFDHIFII